MVTPRFQCLQSQNWAHPGGGGEPIDRLVVGWWGAYCSLRFQVMRSMYHCASLRGPSQQVSAGQRLVQCGTSYHLFGFSLNNHRAENKNFLSGGRQEFCSGKGKSVTLPQADL